MWQPSSKVPSRVKVIDHQRPQYVQLAAEEVVRPWDYDHGLAHRPGPLEDRIERDSIIKFTVHDQGTSDALRRVIPATAFDFAERHAQQACTECGTPLVRETSRNARLHECTERETHQRQPGDRSVGLQRHRKAQKIRRLTVSSIVRSGTAAHASEVGPDNQPAGIGQRTSQELGHLVMRAATEQWLRMRDKCHAKHLMGWALAWLIE
jgi:hypothetical protein